MVVEKNYKYLLELSSDIQKQSADSPAFAIFFKDKIDAFYAANKEELDKAAIEITVMLDEHVSKDLEGKHEFFEVNGKHSWNFFCSQDRNEYHQEYEAFINRPVKIHL